MKKILFSLAFLFLVASAQAQRAVYAVGSAVPGESQQLEKFEDGTFHFHGTLQPGDLFLTTSSTLRSSSLCYAPKYEDSNIVNDGIPYTSSRGDSPSLAWKVLFSADNYRFVLDPSTTTVRGELFEWWYEAWIVGGCVAPDQSEKWLLEKAEPMYQSIYDPYVWTWRGLLKNYSGNMESKRFKILGQYGWDPKSLHPFTQDAFVLDATQVAYNYSHDYKWNLAQNGYYSITVNVFLETITATYLGTQQPDGVSSANVSEPQIYASGRQVRVVSDRLLTATLFTLDGRQLLTESGTDLRLTAPSPGVYVVKTDQATRKVVVK